MSPIPDAAASPVRSRLRSLVRRVLRRARLVARSVVWRWRSSMQARVITLGLVIGIVIVTALGTYLSNAMRDGLFEQRVKQISAETAASTQKARETLASSPAASSASDTQAMLYQLLGMLRTGGPGSRQVFLWREGGGSSAVIDVSSSLDTLVTARMRSATTAADGGQVMQSVAIPRTPDDPRSAVEPGLLVGTTIEVPGGGEFELYYLYDLSSDQETLNFLQSAILGGSVVLLALLIAMTSLITRQAVRPVRVASRVAERLADGHLEERMAVRGHDEMATLARSFNEMATSLSDQIGRMERMSSLQRRFVSDVSHELRTPLSTVRMASDVLFVSRADFDPAARRSAELLQTQLDRFEELLGDLLEISRFDAGAAVLDVERRDVRTIVVAALDYAAPIAQAKGAWLSTVLPDEPVWVDADPRRVERIVRNLLANAIDHAEDGPVDVVAAGDARAVAVVVRDYGIGLRPEDVEHVFDRFWRADPARARQTGGTGLGLAIAREDAHLHGGRLEAWGRPGAGASFRLTLPRRAGIELSGSPLPLVPEPRAASGAVRAVEPDSLGPAALPDIDEWAGRRPADRERR